MNATQFQELSSRLSSLIGLVPLRWGAIQNDLFDSKLDIFKVDTFSQLESAIKEFTPKLQNYLKRKWYLEKCARCDEYLFGLNPNVTPNPNPHDKRFDLTFEGKIKFDVKCSIIPHHLQSEAEECITNPQRMIESFYRRQSNGVRKCYQDRLFIVHYSFVQPELELNLRCAWDTKKEIYRLFSENIHKIKFRECCGCNAGVIFILEREPGIVSFSIDGLTL